MTSARSPGSSELSPTEPHSVALRRLRAQRLVGAGFDSPTEAVRGLLAVQSQDYAGAKWAVGQRVASTSDAELDELFDAGAILRTHVMRPTWHFVDPADIRWLLELTAPRVHQASAYQYRRLEIDHELAARARSVFERSLRGGAALTREELRQALVEAGIAATGPRLGYLVTHAELEGAICSGPRRGRRHTYALVEERVPPARSRTREEALAELARRYVDGHGPAQVADLAWWSGLTVADARKALELATPPLRRETIGGRGFWVAADTAPARAASTGSTAFGRPAIHLLPNYDELLIAFRDRTDAIDPALPEPARVAESILAHVITRDGLVVGGWRREENRGRMKVTLHLRVPLDERGQRGLDDARKRLSTFVGRPVEMVFATSPD